MVGPPDDGVSNGTTVVTVAVLIGFVMAGIMGLGIYYRFNRKAQEASLPLPVGTVHVDKGDDYQRFSGEN